MKEITLEKLAGINPLLIAEEFAAAFGADYDSCDTSIGPAGNFVTARVADTILDGDVEAVVIAHDHTQLSQIEQDDVDAEAAKVTAQGVRSDFLALYPAADAHYAGLSGAQKSGALSLFGDDVAWTAATPTQKADTLRAIVALLVVAVAFLYYRALK